MKEAESRISKIQLQNDIINEISPFFVYPRLAKIETQTNNETTVTAELPTNTEILIEIEKCERDAIATACELGLIINNRQKFKVTAYTCSVPVYNACASEKRIKEKQTKNIVRKPFVMPNLNDVNLKNFAGELKQSNIDETGPFVEIINDDNKRIVIKKTSLCWLLRTECHRLSSDRLRRVQCSTSCNAKYNKKISKYVRPNKIIYKKRINY